MIYNLDHIECLLRNDGHHVAHVFFNWLRAHSAAAVVRATKAREDEEVGVVVDGDPQCNVLAYLVVRRA